MNLTWRREVAPLHQIVRLYLHDLRRAVTAVEEQVRDARPDLISSWSSRPE
ncbi:MAG TPA: hypothetical protein VGP70_04015 [Actinomadura sp.]|jgi:hypothetical protein|nr:hypothetical protein [Actinomadura sp.]